MADSDSLRSRRSRQHRQGDHSLCRHDRAVRVTAPDIPIVTGADFDPVTMLRDLAVRLVAACQADPGNAPLARELRMTLQAIEPDPEPQWDPIAALQKAEWDSRRHERPEV